MGPTGSALRGTLLSTYLLDTTVLISHLRGDAAVSRFLLALLAAGHTLGTSCVNIAEIERGARPGERKRIKHLLDRLRFLETTREAASRAGRYQDQFTTRGVTISTSDALIAGTARGAGAIVLTDNLSDFPMPDVRCMAPPTE